MVNFQATLVFEMTKKSIVEGNFWVHAGSFIEVSHSTTLQIEYRLNTGRLLHGVANKSKLQYLHVSYKSSDKCLLQKVKFYENHPDSIFRGENTIAFLIGGVWCIFIENREKL